MLEGSFPVMLYGSSIPKDRIRRSQFRAIHVEKRIIQALKITHYSSYNELVDYDNS